MKGKQRDLQFRKGNGLKWVSDRIHALELPTLSKRREISNNENGFHG